MHESEKWKGSRSVVSDSSNPMDCSPPGSSVHEDCINMSGFVLTFEERTLLQKQNKQKKSPSLKRDDEQGTILVDGSTKKFKDVAF